MPAKKDVISKKRQAGYIMFSLGIYVSSDSERDDIKVRLEMIRAHLTIKNRNTCSVKDMMYYIIDLGEKKLGLTKE